LLLPELAEDRVITALSRQEWSNWTLACLLPTIQNSHGRKGTSSLLSPSCFLPMVNVL